MNDATPTLNHPCWIDQLTDCDRELLDCLAEEYTERCRGGEPPSIDEYEARYPGKAEMIRRFLATVALMEQIKDASEPSRDRPTGRPAPERIGEFRIVRELGRGGMGVVYEAVQESLGRHVALKAIHHLHLDAKRRQRFQREAQAVGRLHHTNIVPIFGAGDDAGLPYYVMQLISGRGLDALLTTWRQDGTRRDKDHWRFVATIGVQAADAVHHAHEQGILHRDIKPANLLIDDQQTVWVTDFGLAKLTGHDDLTAPGDVIGTLRYLAPEALRGETDRRSDVYSLGLTLYELLTLSLPFGELTASELLLHVGERQPTAPRKLDSRIPRELETIVLKATAREPRDRYRTAGALGDDLRCFLEDRPISARRATAFERAWRWSRRNRVTAAMTTAAAGSLVLAAAVGWVGYMSTTRALGRADQNVALSLEVFGELFETLAPHDTLLAPPPGRWSRPRHPPSRPEDAHPPHRSGGRPAPSPGPGSDPFTQAPADGGLPGPPRRVGAEEDTALLRTVLTFYERFARQNASNPRLQGEAAWAYRRVGALYERLGRLREADQANTRAIELFEELVRQFPNIPNYQSDLVETYIMADPWAAEPDQLGRLRQRFARAVILVDRLAKEAPENLDYAQAQIHVHAKLGAVYQRLNRHDAAEMCYRRAILVADHLIERSEKSVRAKLDRSDIRETLAELLIEQGRTGEGKTLLAAAAAELVELKAPRAMGGPVADRFRALGAAFQGVGEPRRAQEMLDWAAELRARSPVRGREPRGRPPRTPETDAGRPAAAESRRGSTQS